MNQSPRLCSVSFSASEGSRPPCPVPGLLARRAWDAGAGWPDFNFREFLPARLSLSRVSSPRLAFSKNVLAGCRCLVCELRI
eukprot:5253993-Pyramimonas_sp.AAC.1